MALRNMLQNFILELEGKPAGRLFEMSGGGVQAEVIKTTGMFDKHIGSIKQEDMTVTCGIGMSKEFYDWIGSSFGGSGIRKNGAVVSLDFKRTAFRRLEFRDALITSVAFPELTASSKAAAHMTISISPEITRMTADNTVYNQGVYVSYLPKGWHISDFRFRIDGLENECAHIKSISALRFGQKIVEEEGQKHAASADFSNLVINIPLNKASGFQQWFEDFVVKGESGPQNEKKGKLQFLTPNLNKSYFEVELFGLGPFGMEVTKFRGPQTGLPTDFRMYVEALKFNAGPAAVM
jgi:hypothetical protein